MRHFTCWASFVSPTYRAQAGSTIYRYDAENQRIGVDSTSFVVNSQPALSQVLMKEENGEKTFYVYGLGLIGEESAAGYKTYHFDFRGSTVVLSDASGAVAERFQYGPYGELVAGNALVTPFLFNGMYGVMTDGNGLYYMRARFYSAEIKRFLNRDVLLGDVAEGQTLNRFAFVNGRAVSYVDPFGLSSCQCVPNPYTKKYNYNEKTWYGSRREWVCEFTCYPEGDETSSENIKGAESDWYIGGDKGTEGVCKGVNMVQQWNRMINDFTWLNEGVIPFDPEGCGIKEPEEWVRKHEECK